MKSNIINAAAEVAAELAAEVEYFKEKQARIKQALASGIWYKILYLPTGEYVKYAKAQKDGSHKQVVQPSKIDAEHYLKYLLKNVKICLKREYQNKESWIIINNIQETKLSLGYFEIVEIDYHENSR